jgi:hypothetical protein
MTLEEEAEGLQRLLEGKTVRKIWRHRLKELAVEFDDGTRLFVDMFDDRLDFSVTGGSLEGDAS